MRDVGADKNHWFGENAWAHVGHEDVIYATQLYIDLETEVGERLRGRLVYILDFHALGCDAEQGVAHAFYFRINWCLAW